MNFFTPTYLLSDGQKLINQFTAFVERKDKIVIDLADQEKISNQEENLQKLRIVIAIIKDIENEYNQLLEDEEHHKKEEHQEEIGEIKVVQTQTPAQTQAQTQTPAQAQTQTPAQTPAQTRTSFAGVVSNDTSAAVNTADTSIIRGRPISLVRPITNRNFCIFEVSFCGYHGCNQTSERCTRLVHGLDNVYNIIINKPLASTLDHMSSFNGKEDRHNSTSLAHFLLKVICFNGFMNQGCFNNECCRSHDINKTTQVLNFVKKNDKFLDIFCDVCHLISGRYPEDVHESINRFLENKDVHSEHSSTPISPPRREAFPALRR